MDSDIVLDRDQLREITMDDEDLMREILAALIEDTSNQLIQLDAAVRDQDVARCLRLAHYSKGACANVGAQRIAALLKEIERNASNGEFRKCHIALERLASEIERLRQEKV